MQKKRLGSLFAVAICTTAILTPTVADPAAVTEVSCPWFISGGATIRQIDAGFRFNGAHTPGINWLNYVNRHSGLGDVGLYGGGPGTVTYNDGFVGPHDGSNPGYGTGSAHGYVDSADQISAHSVGDIANGNRNRIVSFHTDAFGYTSSQDQYIVDVSDSETAVGPFVALGYKLRNTDNLTVNLVAGWGFVHTDHESGSHDVARLLVTERHTEYTYDYDYIANPALPLQIPGDVSGPNEIILHDPDNVFGGLGPDYSPARQRSSTRNSTVAILRAVSQANLEVNLHEIPIG